MNDLQSLELLIPYAVDKQGLIYYPFENLNKEVEYICPSCRSELVFRVFSHSRGTNHFAHKNPYVVCSLRGNKEWSTDSEFLHVMESLDIDGYVSKLFDSGYTSVLQLCERLIVLGFPNERYQTMKPRIFPHVCLSLKRLGKEVNL